MIKGINLKEGQLFSSCKTKKRYKVLLHYSLIIGNKKKIILSAKNLDTNEILSFIY